MKKLFLASMITSLSLSAAATDSVDISVIGTISPTSCVPSASGGGIVDYGHILPENLSDTGPTVLPAKTVSFNINCDAPTNVALRANSNRLGTTTDAGAENITGSAKANSTLISAGLGSNLPLGLPNVISPSAAGLGTANGSNIGGYMINLPVTQISLDGTAAAARYYSLQAPTATSSWSKISTGITSDGDTLLPANTAYFGYSSNADDLVPQKFQELSGSIVVQGYITDKANLALNQPINLDGSTTIELYYY